MSQQFINHDKYTPNTSCPLFGAFILAIVVLVSVSINWPINFCTSTTFYATICHTHSILFPISICYALVLVLLSERLLTRTVILISRNRSVLKYDLRRNGGDGGVFKAIQS